MGNFNCVFHRNYALITVLSRGIFISMLIAELCGGVHKHNHTIPYHGAVSHSTSTALSKEVMY
jgi:hypothetical protein